MVLDNDLSQTQRSRGARHMGQLLLEEGLIDQVQLNKALAKQEREHGNIIDILIGQGAIEYDTFARFLAQQKRKASIDLANYELDPTVIQLVSANFALAHEVIPIDRLGKLLTVGVVRPLEAPVLEELIGLTGLSVKALLCAPADVRNAIKRYYGPAEDAQGIGDDTLAAAIETPLRLSGAAHVLRQLDSLPTLPATVQRVREMLDDPMAGASDVAKVISNDPPIAAKLLSVANSAAYGLRNHVDTVGLAVTVLGLKETYALVLSASVIDLFKENRVFDFRSFWFESICCANIATAIARNYAREKRSGIFSAGLLHDIGRLALSQVSPEHYGKVDRKLSGSELIAEEQRVIGISHPEAGYQLAEQWGLPTDIAEAIRFHHRAADASEAKQVVAMVAVADAVARAQRPDSESRVPDFDGCRESMDLLGLTNESIIELLTQAPSAEESQGILSLN